jgi:TolB-like protein
MHVNNFKIPGMLVSLLAAATVIHGFDSAVMNVSKKMAFNRLKESGLSRDDAESYSMYFQIALSEATQWEIMDFSVTASLIAERGGDPTCSNLQCEIINGQLLSVDYTCYGSIETIGRTFSLNVQIADIQTGRMVANVSKFYKGKKKNFINKTIPAVARQLAEAVIGKKAVARNKEKRSSESLEAMVEEQAQGSFGDVRGYLNYGTDAAEITTAGKLAFGYLVTGRNMVPDDALRYSYQLQSYLADVGACAMLYIDEMERLMQMRGGNLQCGTMRCAKNVGRLLGVDYMGYGRIRKCGRMFIIRAYIVDVETGDIITKVKQRYRGKEIVFLTEVIPQLSYRLGEVLERKSAVNR